MIIYPCIQSKVKLEVSWGLGSALSLLIVSTCHTLSIHDSNSALVQCLTPWMRYTPCAMPIYALHFCLYGLYAALYTCVLCICCLSVWAWAHIIMMHFDHWYVNLNVSWFDLMMDRATLWFIDRYIVISYVWLMWFKEASLYQGMVSWYHWYSITITGKARATLQKNRNQRTKGKG